MTTHPSTPAPATPAATPLSETPPRGHADPHVAIARTALAEAFGPPAVRDFAVRLWDGSTEEPGSPPPRFTLVLHRPGALRRMLLPPNERRLGEAYVRGDFDVEGSLEAAMSVAPPLLERLTSPGLMRRLFFLLRRLPDRDHEERGSGPSRPRRGRLHSRRRDAAAVRYHYDVGNDFYALWLDRRMVYSCGYFRTGAEELDTAQEAKLDLICRKLRLRPGDRLLDIGCGWGGLILHAAEWYGAEATGITLSPSQAELARKRIAAAGLAGRCHVEIRDYRDLDGDSRFDRIASVGMVEHVGLAMLPGYFANAFRLLRPGGLFLNHGIVRAGGPRSRLGWAVERTLRPWCSFTGAYVFPDGELVTPAEMLAPAEAAGFEIRDLENLREHYAVTLRHWARRLEEREGDAIALVGEPTYRIWRLHHAGAAWGFETNRNGLVQMLLARPDANGAVALPRTREDLYTVGVATVPASSSP
jgi:cyclopropane-fatty-acyl-phospholipid synthase